MTETVEREPASWTNVSGIAPDWLSRWSLGRAGTETASIPVEAFNLLWQFAPRWRTDVYRVVFICPWDYPFNGATPTSGDSFTTREGATSEINVDPDLNAASLIEQIREELHVTHEDISLAIGVARSTLFNWSGKATEPRTQGYRKLLRLHSLAKLLVARLGATGAQSWIASGNPEGITLIRGGNLDALEGAVRAAFFRQPGLREQPSRAVGGDGNLALMGVASATPKRSQRRPKRG